MCGIAGYVGHAPAAAVERTVRAMCDLLAHRGPDHSGVKVLERDGIAFGVGAVRLKIRDLTAAGNQPMAGEAERYWIAYNGEVYNSEPIRAELEARGHVHRSRADTETVLHGFEEWGADSLRRLDGMFALAIVDGADGVVTIARDRMGIKPLYYTLHEGALLYASELKALLGVTPIPFELDPVALDLYLTLGYVPAPHCLVAGVRKLEAGSILTFDGHESRVRQYWTPAEALARAGQPERPAEPVVLTQTTVERAIVEQMVSDVPIGVSLSGGVDSTIVAAVCARTSGSPINTYAIGYVAEKGSRAELDAGVNDDRAAAAAVARIIGSRHTEIDVPIGPRTLDELRHLAGALDEPTWEGSFLAIHRVMGAARRDGVPVLMTGDGSDELFGGYGWHAKTPVQQIAATVPGTATFVRAAAPMLARLPRGQVLVEEATASDRPFADRYAQNHQVFAPDERRRLTGRAASDGRDGALRELLAGIRAQEGRSYEAFIALADLLLWVREHFNQRLDRMSMANSVEARVPFQANAVVDLGLGLRPSEKRPGGRAKGLLRAAFRDLIPPAVLRRPKRPFSVPARAIIQNALRWQPGLLSGGLGDALDPTAVARVLAVSEAETPAGLRRAWCLLVLCLWLDVHAAESRSRARPAELAS